jgi:RNA polymerase sigma-70 factor (ECF subfamily)
MSWIKELGSRFYKDEELIKLWGEGQEWAFDEIYRRYVKQVYHFCFARLGKLDATEATQEIFFKLVRSRESFKEDGIFKVWFWTVVRNQVNDYLRSRYQAKFEEYSEAYEIEMSESEIEKVLLKEQSQKVQKAFALLPDVEREVMSLWLQDLSYDEMKEVLGISLDAIKGRLKRAKIRLYENLEGDV